MGAEQKTQLHVTLTVEHDNVTPAQLRDAVRNALPGTELLSTPAQWVAVDSVYVDG